MEDLCTVVDLTNSFRTASDKSMVLTSAASLDSKLAVALATQSYKDLSKDEESI